MASAEGLAKLAKDLDLALSEAVLEQAHQRLNTLELQRALWMLQGLDPGLEPFLLVEEAPETHAARVLGVAWVLGACLRGEGAARVALLARMRSGKQLLAKLRDPLPSEASMATHLPDLEAAWAPVLGDTLPQGRVMLPKVIQAIQRLPPDADCPRSFGELASVFVRELALRQAADPSGALGPSAPMATPMELTLASPAGLPLGPPQTPELRLPGAPPPKARPFPVPDEPFVPDEEAHWPPEPTFPPEAFAEPEPAPSGPPPLAGPPGQAREVRSQPSGAGALPLVFIGMAGALVVLATLGIIGIAAALFLAS